MAAGASTLFFDFGEVGPLVPVGLGVGVVGESVEARSFGSAAGDYGVRQADDGRGVHAAAQLRDDGAVGTEPPADGFGKDRAEMLFIFGVGAVPDSLARIEIPILADGVLSRPYEDERRGWDGLDADVRRQMNSGEEREPAGEVLFAEREGFTRKEDKGSRMVLQVTRWLSNE